MNIYLGFFVRKAYQVCNLRMVALQLLSFRMGSTLGVEYYLILGLHRQIFEYSRETFYRHALESGHRLVQTKMENKTRRFLLRKHLTVIDLFLGP